MTNFSSSKYLFQHLKGELKFIYPLEEASAIAFLVIEHLFDISKSSILTDRKINLESKAVEQIVEPILTRLKKHEPIQYVFGFTSFYGMKLEVNDSVLIPRQETEELVELIIRENNLNSNLAILDLCTGSGCIIIALKRNILSSACSAVDISELALDVARKNALLNDVEIDFKQADLINDQLQLRSFNIVVSNPPYIPESERELMHRNVLDHEPSLALFVNDQDPLIFYKKIVEISKICLHDEGRLYFEINERFGKEVQDLLIQNGFSNARIIKDINGKDRIVTGRKDAL